MSDDRNETKLPRKNITSFYFPIFWCVQKCFYHGGRDSHIPHVSVSRGANPL